MSQTLEMEIEKDLLLHTPKMAICPYNETHTVPEGKMDGHLQKCREAYIEQLENLECTRPDILPCRYNPAHKCWLTELSYHEMHCLDRKHYISPYVLEKLSRVRFDDKRINHTIRAMRDGYLPPNTDLTIHSISKLSVTPLASTSGRSSLEHFGLHYIIEEMDNYRKRYERRRKTPNHYAFDDDSLTQGKVGTVFPKPESKVLPLPAEVTEEEDVNDEIWGMDLPVLRYGMSFKQERKLTKAEKMDQLRQRAMQDAADQAKEVETVAAAVTDDFDDDWKSLFGFVDT